MGAYRRALNLIWYRAGRRIQALSLTEGKQTECTVWWGRAGGRALAATPVLSSTRRWWSRRWPDLSPLKIGRSPHSWKERFTLSVCSILRNHIINNLSTENASPPVKLSLFPVEFLINHFPTAAMAFHSATPVTSFHFNLEAMRRNPDHHQQLISSYFLGLYTQSVDIL
jgi:hypothetical protein